MLPGQDSLVTSMVAQAKKASIVELHGNASTEGPSPDYNLNLSCYRVLAIQKIFSDAGVTVSMSLVALGATTVYGDALENRNVVMVAKTGSTP